MTRLSPRDAILVDEVGIESGCVEGLLLKSAYQPIFMRDGDSLRMVAVEAFTRVQREGRVSGLDDLPATPASRESIEELCQVLHLDNHRNLSVAGCDLFVDHDLSRNKRLCEAFLDAREEAEAAGALPLAPGQLVCRIAGSALQDPDAPGLLAELREAGFRVAIDVFDRDDLAWPFQPDVAEIGAVWLAKIAAESAAARLLAPLVEAHRRQDTRVFMRGIATADHLRLAIEAGADYLAGDHLAGPVLAGTLMEEEPMPLDDLLEPRSALRLA